MAERGLFASKPETRRSQPFLSLLPEADCAALVYHGELATRWARKVTRRAQSKKPKAGEHLHRLVELIERVTHATANVTVESPKLVPDRETGGLREHDIVLTFKQQHHSFVIALECRDRSRPVNVTEVEAYSDKCRCTGVDKGIIVGTRGFTKTALRKGKARGIGTLTLSEARKMQWCSAPGVHVYQKDLTGISTTLHVHGTYNKPYQAFEPGGAEMTQQWFKDAAGNALQTRAPSFDLASGPPTGTQVLQVRDTRPGFYILLPDGNRVPCQAVEMVIEYRWVTTVAPFSFHHYQDQGKNVELMQVAVAQIEAPGSEGTMLLQQVPGQSTTVAFFKKGPDKQAP